MPVDVDARFELDPVPGCTCARCVSTLPAPSPVPTGPDEVRVPFDEYLALRTTALHARIVCAHVRKWGEIRADHGSLRELEAHAQAAQRFASMALSDDPHEVPRGRR